MGNITERGPNHRAVMVLLVVLLGLVAVAASTSSRPERNGNAYLGLPGSNDTTEVLKSQAVVALGKKLFFDTRLSADSTISCASCHRPELAFSDGLRVARGVSGRSGTRNAPTLLNVAFSESFFWDGRRPSLESQARDPFVNPIEHGLTSHETLIQIIKNDPDYQKLFRDVYGVSEDAIDLPNITRALAGFQRTLVAGDSAFDRYYFGKNAQAMSQSAIRGWELFRGRARCVTCHIIGKDYALFTDNRFHSLSIGLRKIGTKLPDLVTKLAKMQREERERLIFLDPAVSELGRFVVTLDPADIGKFKTPSLRNAALTAPYMHDGSVKTLEDAIEIEVYYRSTQDGRPLVVAPDEKADLLEFLRALTSPHLSPETSEKRTKNH